MLAPYSSRFIAELIDGAIIFFVAAGGHALVGLPAFGAASSGDKLALLGTSTLVAFVYLPTIMRVTNGRTAGKIAMSIVVVRDDERPMSFGLATVREVLLKQLAFGLTIVATLTVASVQAIQLIDYLWPLWDDQNRALHDMVVKTHVFRV